MASTSSSGCAAGKPDARLKKSFVFEGFPDESGLPDASIGSATHLECAPSKPYALLAQLVEHFIRNEGVICSNQIEGTISSALARHCRIAPGESERAEH